MALTRSLFCLLGLIAITWAAPDGRILEGNDAKSGEVPHMVSVRLDNAHVCGGTIISENMILTAGHCVSQLGPVSYAVNRVSVRVGSINQFAGGQIHQVKSIAIHPSYGNFLHDIAAITVVKSFVWDEKVKKVELPPAEEEYETGTEVTVSGWGLQSTGASPYKLQHTTLQTLHTSECEYRAGYGYNSVLCLDHPEKKGICRGDEGTGAVVDNKLVGVLSFAFGSCGSKYPDIASRVSFYREWIDSLNAENVD